MAELDSAMAKATELRQEEKATNKQTVKDAPSDSEDSDEEEEGDGHYQVVEISPRHAYNTRQRLGLTLRRGMQRIVSPQMMTNAI